MDDNLKSELTELEQKVNREVAMDNVAVFMSTAIANYPQLVQWVPAMKASFQHLGLLEEFEAAAMRVLKETLRQQGIELPGIGTDDQ